MSAHRVAKRNCLIIQIKDASALRKGTRSDRGANGFPINGAHFMYVLVLFILRKKFSVKGEGNLLYTCICIYVSM